jgi:superfamily II DNA or RNA helicase
MYLVPNWQYFVQAQVIRDNLFQRRGRVLRLCEGKEEAVIYDLIVVPDASGDEALFNTERNEVEKELRRIRDFAEMSENKHYTRKILQEILTYYNLTL